MNNNLLEKSEKYLRILCRETGERCVGSRGNILATNFFEKELAGIGWDTRKTEFDAIDWEENGAILRSDNSFFDVKVSPYSLPFSGEGILASATTTSELESLNMKDKILLLSGDIAREQLMPKNFVFYNPEEHQKIIALLEKGEPKAIICATGRNAALAGGVYPFPLIEDGDFDIPSVYMTEEEGKKLIQLACKNIFLESGSKRIPGKGYNVIATRGSSSARRIVVTAHIDAKKGTPGAIDNATGIVVLILLAEHLSDYNGENLIELVALNGEDYYAVPGQMNYIMSNQGKFNEMLLNINIDGAGYKEGPSALSLFDLPDRFLTLVHEVIGKYDGLTEGIQWPQGDHSIFLQYGVPAIAVSSKWFIDNIDGQDITHTPKDDIDIVDYMKLIEISEALNDLIRRI
jgi:aminopeptidase YwaD